MTLQADAPFLVSPLASPGSSEILADAGVPCVVADESEAGVGTDHEPDRRLLGKALAIRRTEERLLQLFAEGRLFGTVHTCIGQEWVGVAVAEALRIGDYVFSNHRGHGHYLALTDDIEGLIAEAMGRATGTCGGRGGSQHLCRDRFFSNGVQGGIVPVAAGLAMAHQLDGSDGIAVVFIGDGTLGEGVVYETLNIASKWRLPLLIILEDNGIAQSTRSSETLAGTVRGRAQAFGIAVTEAATWRPVALVRRAREAVDGVRRGRAPALLHVTTCRLRAHSKGDDDRDPQEVASFAERDPLNCLVRSDNSSDIQALLAQIDKRIERAVVEAEAAPFAQIDVSPGSGVGTEASQPASPRPAAWPGTFAQAIRQALADAMQEDHRILLLGEDIRDPYGGAFKVTAGLSTLFDDRVHNTPISEAALVGIGNGLALAGWRPVVEIMFGDFLMLAADQILNHAAKFAWMYNQQVHVPILVRTPMGGYRGYGPTHSQCLEKHLLGLPDTQVLALHQRCCPYSLYRELLGRIDRPTLVIENKELYSQRADVAVPEGWELRATSGAFPTVVLSPDADPELTILTYGGMAGRAEAAMIALGQQQELPSELLVPTRLYPLDFEPILESVGRTGRLLIVEEAQGFAGFGSEVLARVLEESPGRLIQAARIHAAACPVPASRPAEELSLPSIEAIVRQATELCSQ